MKNINYTLLINRFFSYSKLILTILSVIFMEFELMFPVLFFLPMHNVFLSMLFAVIVSYLFAKLDQDCFEKFRRKIGQSKLQNTKISFAVVFMIGFESLLLTFSIYLALVSCMQLFSVGFVFAQYVGCCLALFVGCANIRHMYNNNVFEVYSHIIKFKHLNGHVIDARISIYYQLLIVSFILLLFGATLIYPLLMTTLFAALFSVHSINHIRSILFFVILLVEVYANTQNYSIVPAVLFGFIALLLSLLTLYSLASIWFGFCFSVVALVAIGLYAAIKYEFSYSFDVFGAMCAKQGLSEKGLEMVDFKKPVDELVRVNIDVNSVNQY